MKKFLCGMIVLLSVCALVGMEGSDDDEWVEISLSDSQDNAPRDCFSIISNKINTDYAVSTTLQVPLNTALDILKIPQQIYPIRSTNGVFDSSFFDKLCEQNTIFLRARDVVACENKQYVKKTITGSTIDAYNTLVLPQMKCLCIALQKYIQQKAMKQCEERRSLILARHTDHITGVDMNTKTIVSGSKDKTTHIWSAHTGTLQCVLRHMQPVECVSLHPCKPLVATVAQDILYLWNTKNRQYLTNAMCPGYTFNRAYFSDTGDKILAYNAQEGITSAFFLIIDCDDQVNSLGKFCVVNTPLSNTNGHMYKRGKGDPMVAIINDTQLSLKLNTFVPTLCEAALCNSKQNKKELNALLLSNTLKNKLPIEDQSRLIQSIKEYLATLEIKDSHKHKQYDTDDGSIELQLMKRRTK